MQINFYSYKWRYNSWQERLHKWLKLPKYLMISTSGIWFFNSYFRDCVDCYKRTSNYAYCDECAKKYLGGRKYFVCNECIENLDPFDIQEASYPIRWLGEAREEEFKSVFSKRIIPYIHCTCAECMENFKTDHYDYQ